MELVDNKKGAIPVVVMPGNSPISLTVIRSLGRRNIPVYVVFPKTELNNIFYHIVKTSRYITRKYYIEDRGDPAERAKMLSEIGEELKEKAVLIPVTDKDMIMISEYRTLLCRYFNILMPDHELLKVLLKKNLFAKLAKDYRLPVPKTFSVNSPEEMKVAADQIRYPCIIKPDWRQENWFKLFGRRKVVISGSKKQLLRNYNKIKNFSGEILLQEIIKGKEKNIYCSFTFIDENSVPLDFYVCRKLRQSPAYFGNTALAESVEEPEIVELTKEICKTLNLTGYVSIEFKKDPLDGKFKIIEITPGRINRQAGIAAASGVDIPYIWYTSMTGIEYERSGKYNTKVKWISELLELSALPAYFRNRDINLKSWWRSLKNLKSFEIYSGDDLRPIFSLIPASLFYALKNLFSKIIK